MGRAGGHGPRDVLSAVRSALGGEPRVDPRRHPIGLALEGGVLTLEGEVADVAAKKLALERAASVAGVHHLVDRLRVAPARRMNDAEIRDHLCDALLAEPALAGCAVGARDGEKLAVLREPPGAGHAVAVSVAGGVVTLDGEVPGLGHKRLAGVLAWWVPGTRDVVNGLEVVPPEQDGEGEIRDAVVAALEKDPFLEAGRIRVGVRGTRVTLEGFAGSEEQREMAELDAWMVFGVDAVVNRVELRSRGG